MEWLVVKLGAEMYDPLHAYGVGLALASASGASVELRDEGLIYRLSSSISIIPEISAADLLNDILVLPTPEQLQLTKQELSKGDITLANLDGLLAVLFTVQGVRPVSVCDLVDHQRQLSASVQAGLNKVNQAILRWEKHVTYLSKQSATGLASILEDYSNTSPVVPFPSYKGDRDLSALMTLDPSFGYSIRRPISDGLITHKTNITIYGPRFAMLFASIGAARFLRAQHIGSKLVNFYVPVAKVMTIRPETTMPLLTSTAASSNQATIYQWLAYSQAGLPNTDWKGLAYQTLQTQGASQSISIGRGYLDYHWLNSLKVHLGSTMINYWKLLLSRQSEQLPIELDPLIDTLMNRCSAAWLNHLRELSLCSLEKNQDTVRSYTLEELKEVTQTMMPSKNLLSFGVILEREDGTVRFGRALRLLGRINNSALSEIIEKLDAAHTVNQIIRIAATIAQECAVANAKTKFIIVPNEADLKILIDDIEQYTPRSIADLLISLSFVRYPGNNGAEDSSEVFNISQTIQEAEEEKQ